MDFTCIIPARLSSTRLPGKPLISIVGIPMVIRVMEQAKQSGAKRVIVATDDQSVLDTVLHYGGEGCLTAKYHPSGTDRLAEVIDLYNFDENEIIVNVQGDEPLIPPVIIRQCAQCLANSQADMATLAVPLEQPDEVFNPNIVKIVVNQKNEALYFSRAAIPWDREKFNKNLDESVFAQGLAGGYLRHIGIYAYHAGFVKQFVKWGACPLEQLEMLEQLRALWHGSQIQVALATVVPPHGVDTQQDLDNIISLISS